jgi:hypothetical protein
VNFLGIPERINKLLYGRELRRLSRNDASMAVAWTKELIRERNPHWNEDQVERYYVNLLKIRILAVDEWSRRHGMN